MIPGRYAGLISGGSFEMDGVTYETSKNSRDMKSTLHGGEKGWGQVYLHPAAKTKNSITFVAFDRGSNGFPGRAASR
jgi:aldose 1-epimerase